MAKKSGKKKSASKGKRKAAPKAGKKSSGKRSGGAGPSPVKTGKGPSVGEIGRAVVAAINAGRPDREIWDKFWSSGAVSVEGEGMEMAWKGRKGIESKSDWWYANNKLHGASAEGPFVGAQGFAIKFKMDVEELNTGMRRVSEEVGVYTVNNGKIVREEFMYGPSHTVSSPGSSAGLAPVGG
jgi:hypothetical protein